MAYVQIYSVFSAGFALQEYADNKLTALAFFLIAPWVLYGVINWCIYYIAYYVFMLIFNYILFTLYFKIIAMVFSTSVVVKTFTNGDLNPPLVFIYIALMTLLTIEIFYDLPLKLYCGLFILFPSLVIVGENERYIDETPTMAFLMSSLFAFSFYGSSLLSMLISKLAFIFDLG